MRLADRDASKVTNARWKTTVGQKVSRGKLSAAFGADGIVERMWERHAVKKLWAKGPFGRGNESGATGYELRQQPEAAQLVVRGMRRSARLEKPERSVDYTRQHGPQRDEGFLGQCSAAKCVRVKKLPAHSSFGQTSSWRSDSLVQVFVEGLPERSRLKMMEDLRRFIMVDSHEAVNIGDLERTSESLSVVEPKRSEDFPAADASKR